MQSFLLNCFFFLLDSVSWKLVYIQSWRQQSARVTQIRGNVVFSLFFKVPTRAGESRARSLFTGSVFIFIITCDRCSCSHLTKNCFVFTFSVERPSPAEADPNLKKYNPPPPPHLLWACPDAPQWDLTPHRTGLQEASNSPPALPASHVQTFVLFLFVFFLFLFGWIIMLSVPEETLTINGKRAFLALHS